MQLPITLHFRATSYFKAFLLNSINVTLSTSAGYITHIIIDKYFDVAHWLNILLTLICAFITSFLINVFMFYFFAYGESLIVQNKPKKNYNIHQGSKKLKK